MDCRNEANVKVRFLEHTADVGIEVEAPTLEKALEGSACALFSICADLERIEPSVRLQVKLGPFSDPSEMLFEFLNELIYLGDAKSMVFCRADVRKTEPYLEADIYGERIDFSKHVLKEQVKAATYHQLTLKETEKGWIARVIFDV